MERERGGGGGKGEEGKEKKIMTSSSCESIVTSFLG